jgi:hypothetical protein
LCMRYEYQRIRKKDRDEETPMHERHRCCAWDECQCAR